MARKLSAKVLRSIYLWYHGDMTSNEVVKRFATGGTALTSALYCGGIGTFFGPMGILIGGTIGGIAGGIAGYAAADAIVETRLWRLIFRLRPAQALDNAYDFFGINPCAPDDEVEAAYQRRLMTDHPNEPSGSEEAFKMLETYHTIIRVARGEKF